MKLPGSGVTVVCTALTGATLPLAACGSESPPAATSTVTVTAPSGPSVPSTTTGQPQTSRDFDVGTFTAVRLAAHYALVVNIGSPTSVRAEGDPAALDLLDIRSEGATLVAGVKPNVSWPPDSRVTVTVTNPTLTSAELDGSGGIHIGPLRADALSLTQAGSGDIEAHDLTLARITVSSSGSGRVRLGGSAQDANVRHSGSGEADLTTLAVKRADVSVSGSGSLMTQALEKVSGSISGSGDVRVTGGAACSIATSGSGKATCA